VTPARFRVPTMNALVQRDPIEMCLLEPSNRSFKRYVHCNYCAYGVHSMQYMDSRHTENTAHFAERGFQQPDRLQIRHLLLFAQQQRPTTQHSSPTPAGNKNMTLIADISSLALMHSRDYHSPGSTDMLLLLMTMVRASRPSVELRL
jgi:hypothetical protein